MTVQVVEIVTGDGLVIARYLFDNTANTHHRAELPLETGWTLRFRVADFDTGETVHERAA